MIRSLAAMDGVDASRMWKTLKQRLGLKGMGCCGAGWSSPTATMPTLSVAADFPGAEGIVTATSAAAAAGMNLAMALAAERSSREGSDGVKTLKRLIEETDGVDWKRVRRSGKEEEGEDCNADGACCVCMERCKGAAFIPCGHAFCRVCSRELWVNRGSCPICNRSIVEILDLY